MPRPRFSPVLPFEATLRDRRVLVTGHTGFTGGWLCLWLNGIGVRPAGLALEPATKPSLYAAAEIGAGTDSTIGDIRDREAVEAVFRSARPEVVFHLAAQPIVSRSYGDPLGTLATNIMGTAHVLEAARRSGSTKAVVAVTTDKVYQDQGAATGFREDDRLGGKDPYSASKAAAEIVAASYRDALIGSGAGPAIATARGGNIIGGGDWSDDRIVPDLARAKSGNGRLTLRRPSAVRPWQHVLALVHGYLLLAAALLEGRAGAASGWNFGPAATGDRSVRDLVEAVDRAWGGPPVTIGGEEAAFHETNFLRLDSTKAREELGWAPPLSFEETAGMTADWYRGYSADPSAARDLTVAQIETYRQRLVTG